LTDPADSTSSKGSKPENANKIDKIKQQNVLKVNKQVCTKSIYKALNQQSIWFDIVLEM
jgi:hypothetical protein